MESLSKIKDDTIVKPDKGIGVVLLNRNDYINKMQEILGDRIKFAQVKEDTLKLVLNKEPTINVFCVN